MKKLTVFTCLLLILLILAGCGGAVTVGGFSSKYMNSDDYDAAVEEVLTCFKEYEGCTVKKIEYAGDAAVKAEADSRGLAPEQIIVLTSTFETDDKEHDTVFEPNQTYEGYKWILTRGTSADLWEVTDRGYD